MCSPDLCVLKSVVLGYKGYNLGAIVARRLHNNSRRGDFFGGIYATRVANFLNIAPQERDMIVHHSLERNEQFLHYRLIYDRRNVVPVTLPAPYLFDYQAKGRYIVTREEAAEHERRAEAAQQHAAAQEAVASASQYYPSFTYGYQPGGHWY